MMAEGKDGALICHACAALCKEIIEAECLRSGVQVTPPSPYVPKSKAPAPNPPKP